MQSPGPLQLGGGVSNEVSPSLLPSVVFSASRYTPHMADDSVFEVAMDNLKEAGQRIRATQHLMRSQGMNDDENNRDLVTRLSTALAMTKAAYMEARRRKGT